jgi:actin
MDASGGERLAIVIDAGSGTVKAGFCGDDVPSVFPCVATVAGCAGEQALLCDGAKRPVERGRVCDWERMGRVWHHSFHNVLRVNPAEHAVLLTETPTNSKVQKVRCCVC